MTCEGCGKAKPLRRRQYGVLALEVCNGCRYDGFIVALGEDKR